MAIISKSGIGTGNTIQAEHITRIIDALNGTGSADVIATGSFTGSFNGSADIWTVQDLTVFGTASINYFETIYETSSIIYQSGSTKFGNSADDTHQFTGSIYVLGDTEFTGSLNVSETVYIGNTAQPTTSASLYIRQPSASSSSESPIIDIQVEDANSYFRLNNGTATDGVFAPIIITRQADAADRLSFYIDSVVDPTYDTPGAVDVMRFRARKDLDFIQNRDLYAWYNYTSRLMSIDAAGNLNIVASVTASSYTGSFVGDGAGLYNIPASGITGLNLSQIASGSATASIAPNTGFRVNTDSAFTGSMTISGSTSPALNIIGSGSAVFTVNGSVGEIFSVSDSLSGSLFAVNNSSGFAILDVDSDNTIKYGDPDNKAVTTTVKNTVAAVGAFTVYSLPTASYDGAWFEYVAKSGSDARAGQIMSLWSGTAVNFTETTTTDFGNTSGLSFTVAVTGSNFALTGSVATAGWTIKTIVRSI